MSVLVRSFIFALMALGAMPALAANVDFTHVAFAKVSKTTSVPVGHADFCRRNRGECGPIANPVGAVVLTEKSWTQLLAINSRYNTQIVAITDAELYRVNEFWTYPSAGFGDCEDFALVKRRALMDAGWPESALLITVVRQANGEGHAVLMVRTDRGDMILDNQDGMVRVWNETSYLFLKRQSQTDSSQWVDILDERPTVVALR